MKPLYGYDIDGVAAKNIELKKPYVVISGRTFEEYHKGGHPARLAQDVPVYIRGQGELSDWYEAGKFKAMMVNYLGVTEFYEDSKLQAKFI